MKYFFIRGAWAFFWLFFGLIVARNNEIQDPILISSISLLCLFVADALKFFVRKIINYVLT